MVIKESKRNPYNLKNRTFRKILNHHDTKETIDVMKGMGCANRAVYLQMCINLGNKHYGKKIE